MKNEGKMEPKWEPKSIKNWKETGKKACQKWCKIWCWKWSSKVRFWMPFWFSGATPGGKEGKPPKAALRHLASSIWNAWHRPVSADCSSGRPPTPWDPGCWSDYFYTRNWRTLVETSVTGAKKGIQKRHAKFNAEKVVNINAKRLPKWGQNRCWCGKSSKYHQNGFQNWIVFHEHLMNKSM